MGKEKEKNMIIIIEKYIEENMRMVKEVEKEKNIVVVG